MQIFEYVLLNKEFVKSTYHSLNRGHLEHYLYNETYTQARDVVKELNYVLSAELLSHARDNNSRSSTYEPNYGFRCAGSPIVDAIWKSGKFLGSASFPKNVFASNQLNDLYYSVHSFDFTVHLGLGIGNSYLEITDIYDYDHQLKYTGVAGIADSLIVID